MTVDDDVLEWPEQYSDETRAALQRAAASLLETVRGYTEHLVGLRGGTSEIPALFERNKELAAAVADLNDRVSDHTGTTPLLLESFDDDDDEEEWEESVDDGEGPEIQDRVFVLSRWDLHVHDAAALIAAGRAAHCRHDPGENDEDAAVAVTSSCAAIDAISREAGEPWFALPGVEVASGARVYLVADEPGDPLPDDPSEMLDHVITPPPGRVAFSEGWQ